MGRLQQSDQSGFWDKQPPTDLYGRDLATLNRFVGSIPTETQDTGRFTYREDIGQFVESLRAHVASGGVP